MKKKIYLVVAILAFIGLGFFYYFSIYPKQLRENIYQKNGYEVHEANDNYTISFEFNENWLDIPEGETKVFNEKLGKKFDSTVLLESVRNNAGNYSLNFNIKHDLNPKNGKFLSHYKITNHGDEIGFLSRKDIFNFYNRNEQIIKLSIVSGGSGPGESFSGNFNFSFLDLVKEIELSLYLYEYKKINFVLLN